MTGLRGGFGFLLAGLALAALLQDPTIAGTALVPSLVAAASAFARRPMLQAEPVKAETDHKTLGDTLGNCSKLP